MTKPEAAPTKRYLTPQEACEYLGVSRNTLMSFKIPASNLNGDDYRRLLRFDVRDLDKFMQARKESNV